MCGAESSPNLEPSSQEIYRMRLDTPSWSRAGGHRSMMGMGPLDDEVAQSAGE